MDRCPDIYGSQDYVRIVNMMALYDIQNLIFLKLKVLNDIIVY